MNESSERWLPVPGYEGYYEVSDCGRVRSLDRWVDVKNRWGSISRRFFSGTIIRPQLADNYLRVGLHASGSSETRLVHCLVLEAFVGPRPPGLVACHGSTGSMDNNLMNLRWDTDSANMVDVVVHGNHQYANRTNCALGHELRAPNLQPTALRRRDRRCYACSLTTIWARYYGYDKSDPEYRTEADRRYAEILHFGRPIKYAGKLAGKPRWQPDSA